MISKETPGAGPLTIVLLLLHFWWSYSAKAPPVQEPAPQPAPQRIVVANPPTDADLEKLIAEGNGRDYLALSQRDRVRLAIKIHGQTKQGEAYDYVEFLTTFYDRAQRQNKPLLEKPIGETAAVYAAFVEQQDAD